MNWELREAVAADATQLAAIDASASAYPWPESRFAPACAYAASARERVLLLELDAQVSGFVVYSRVLDEGSIHNIAVHPSRQGQGAARGLMQGAFELLGKSGAKRCLLEVRASNAAARGLYRGLGFQVDCVRKNYYPAATGREDALLMSREL